MPNISIITLARPLIKRSAVAQSAGHSELTEMKRDPCIDVSIISFEILDIHRVARWRWTCQIFAEHNRSCARIVSPRQINVDDRSFSDIASWLVFARPTDSRREIIAPLCLRFIFPFINNQRELARTDPQWQAEAQWQSFPHLFNLTIPRVSTTVRVFFPINYCPSVRETFATPSKRDSPCSQISKVTISRNRNRNNPNELQFSCRMCVCVCVAKYILYRQWRQAEKRYMLIRSNWTKRIAHHFANNHVKFGVELHTTRLNEKKVKRVFSICVLQTFLHV